MGMDTILTIQGNIRANDMRELLMAFFPYGRIQIGEEPEAEWQYLKVIETEKNVKASFRDAGGKVTTKDRALDSTETPRQFYKKLVYDLLFEATGTRLKWGTMTGIRPVRIAHRERVKRTGEEDLQNMLSEQYRLSGEASDLIMKISRLEIENLYPLDRKKVQVYVNIPFCPSRCSYCSFITQEAGTDRKLLDDYLEALEKEICLVGAYLKEIECEVESVYVGGGTPTVLETKQMERLLAVMSRHMPFGKLKEFTFEAGRPDTITAEKLRLLRDNGVDRISVNPQTFQEKTLENLGRSHDVDTFLQAYEMARHEGFHTVNCDLILGLEGESKEDMIASGKKLADLEPENITVHSLSRKRSSAMSQTAKGSEDLDGTRASDASEAASFIYRMFAERGYRPYYLYRQKYCVNNGENIGFSKPGHEGFYNMAIMSDKRTVIGLGAGSTGKVYDPDTDGYERMETVKNVHLYVENSVSEGEKKISQLKRLFLAVDTK